MRSMRKVLKGIADQFRVTKQGIVLLNYYENLRAESEGL